MRSLTFYALAFPLLVAADSEWGVPAGGYGQYMKDVNWNTVSYTNGFGGSQPPPTDTPVVQDKAAEQVVAPPSSTPGAASQSSPVSSASGSQNTGSSDSSSQGSGSGSGSGTCASGMQTVTIKNTSGKDLHVAPGFPWQATGPLANGNFDCSVISDGSSCTTCQRIGTTGGNLQLGYGTSDGCARGTWIEGNSLTEPCVDISYIPGYSVPVQCTSSGDGPSQSVGSMEGLCVDEACSNCNANNGGSMQSGSCQNPAGNSGNPLQSGPSTAFFKKVETAAYTFPDGDKIEFNPQNHVVAFGSAWSSMTCVAGSPMGNGGSSKRDALPEVEKRAPQPEARVLEDVLSEPEQRPTAHRHLGRRHGKRRHSHAHDAAVEKA